MVRDWESRSAPVLACAEASVGYGTGAARGSSLPTHSPELKSVKSTCPFQGIAFITNDAFAV